MPPKIKRTRSDEAKLIMQRKKGKYLRALRVASKYSQKEAAGWLNLHTAQYISNIERGVSPPSIEYLKLCILKYGIDAQELALVLSHIDHEFYQEQFK